MLGGKREGRLEEVDLRDGLLYSPRRKCIPSPSFPALFDEKDSGGSSASTEKSPQTRSSRPSDSHSFLLLSWPSLVRSAQVVASSSFSALSCPAFDCLLLFLFASLYSARRPISPLTNVVLHAPFDPDSKRMNRFLLFARRARPLRKSKGDAQQNGMRIGTRALFSFSGG